MDAAEVKVKSVPTDAVKSRLVVVGTVYWSSPAGEPVSTPVRSAKWVDTDEQPFVRNDKAQPHWKNLNYGWVVGLPVMVVVRNDDPAAALHVRFAGIPGPEDAPHVLVGPGESFAFAPGVGVVFLRTAATSPTRFTLTAFPDAPAR
ncbi:MAG: hypothetical protein ACRC7O_04570 [Fimbriiglobus sp.]